jgi:hypothetical protein
MKIDDLLQEQLKPSGISSAEFSELLIRLLDYGVIARDDSQVEATLYDRFLRCAEVVEDYLAVIGARLQHDRRFNFVRVFPPGAEVPGLADEVDRPFTNGFRARLSQQDVAVILVLRTEYEKSLREGQVDEKGRAMISLEGLAIAMHNLLKRSLPEAQGERRQVFRRLRQLRLVQFSAEEDLDNPESWLSIQPSITSFVTDEVLSTLMGGEASGENDEEFDAQARSVSGGLFASSLADETETEGDEAGEND